MKTPLPCLRLPRLGKNNRGGCCTAYNWHFQPGDRGRAVISALSVPISLNKFVASPAYMYYEVMKQGNEQGTIHASQAVR